MCGIPGFKFDLAIRHLPCGKSVFAKRYFDPTHAGYLEYGETVSPIHLAETYLHIYHESQGIAYTAFVSFFGGVN
jgi:hypothetical protein